MKQKPSNFVADVIGLIESSQFKFLSKELDDEAMLFTFSLEPGLNFTILGGGYPAETSVLGGATERTFEGLHLAEIIGKLQRKPSSGVTAAAVAPAVVEASRAERDIQDVLRGKFSQVAELKRSEAGVAFKLHGKSYSVNVCPDYPRNTVVMIQNDMRLSFRALSLFLLKTFAK